MVARPSTDDPPCALLVASVSDARLTAVFDSGPPLLFAVFGSGWSAETICAECVIVPWAVARMLSMTSLPQPAPDTNGSLHVTCRPLCVHKLVSYPPSSTAPVNV